MKTYALQLARDGSKSVVNKNLYEHKGKPLYKHNLDIALSCKKINKTWLSTDISFAIDNEPSDIIIHRPSVLCTDKAHVYDAILHGIKFIELETGSLINNDILIILLGNSASVTDYDLTEGIRILRENDHIDSILSLSQYNMFNPFRVFQIKKDYAKPYFSKKTIKKYSKQKKSHCEKDEFGDMYFFNGSFWMTRGYIAKDGKGLEPYPWMGKTITPYIQKEGTMEVDAEWQLKNL